MIKNYALLYIFFGMHLIQAMEITRERYPAETPLGNGICYLAMLPVEMRSNIAEYLVRGDLEVRLRGKALEEKLLRFSCNNLMKKEDSQISRRVWIYDNRGDSEPVYTMVHNLPCVANPLLLGVKDTHYLVLNALHDRRCEQRVTSSLKDRLIRQSQDDGLIKLADMPNPGCLYTLEFVRGTRWLVTRMCNEAGEWVEKRRRKLPAEAQYCSILVGSELEGVGLLGKDGRVDIIKDINYKKDHLFKLFARMGVFEGLPKEPKS